MTTLASASRKPRARVTTGAAASLGLRLHEAGSSGVETETDGKYDIDGEVDPEDLKGREWSAASDVEESGSDERQDEPAEHHELNADVLHEVVVDAAATLDCGDDGCEVVVGEDHVTDFLGHLRAGDAHRDTDVCPLEGRGVVDPVPGHRDHVALPLEHIDEAHLVLGCHASDDSDLIDLALEIGVTECCELDARERTALDPQLSRDRGRCGRMVAGDHAYPDSGFLAASDGVPSLSARRVDDPDQREQRHTVDLIEQRARGVEVGGVDVTGRHGKDAQPFAC